MVDASVAKEAEMFDVSRGTVSKIIYAYNKIKNARTWIEMWGESPIPALHRFRNNNNKSAATKLTNEENTFLSNITMS